MNISIYEQETVIQISRDSDKMKIWTSDKTMMTKLDKLTSSSSEWSCTGENKIDGDVCDKEYTANKGLLTFRSSRRKLTDEQKAEFAKRFKS
jgi:hypothetical protein